MAIRFNRPHYKQNAHAPDYLLNIVQKTHGFLTYAEAQHAFPTPVKKMRNVKPLNGDVVVQQKVCMFVLDIVVSPSASAHAIRADDLDTSKANDKCGREARTQNGVKFNN